MSERNSQNVRLKEEVMSSLGTYIRGRGTSQQHVVSVGAWFFMCMPDQIARQIGEAFYEWCKDNSQIARIPKNIAPLLDRVIKLINEECSKEEARIEQEMESDPASIPEKDWAELMLRPRGEPIKQAADQALNEAEKKLRTPRKKKQGPSNDKERRSQ